MKPDTSFRLLPSKTKTKIWVYVRDLSYHQSPPMEMGDYLGTYFTASTLRNGVRRGAIFVSVMLYSSSAVIHLSNSK